MCNSTAGGGNRGRRAAGVVAGLPSRRPRLRFKRAAARSRLDVVLLVVAHRTLRATALGVAPGLKQTGDVGDRLVVFERLSAASSQRVHARGRTGPPWL
eukprot:scaffold61461_cov67-Phaeocystis_antarctica.AAC.3